MAEATQETPQQRNGQVENGKPETSHHPRTDSERQDQGYYGIPPVKEHTWTWEIPVYFWLGGIGSGAHVINTIARLMGHDDKALIRAGRYTTLFCMLLSPATPRSVTSDVPNGSSTCFASSSGALR